MKERVLKNWVRLVVDMIGVSSGRISVAKAEGVVEAEAEYGYRVEKACCCSHAWEGYRNSGVKGLGDQVE